MGDCSKKTSQALLANAARILDSAWSDIQAGPSAGVACPAVAPELRQAIADSINSKTRSYRYVLPTHLLAKLADPSLDCRCVQEGAGLPGSFDARSFCRAVIVPFDRVNHNVLGGSGDPYVSNPLRIPLISQAAAAAQKDKTGFANLRTVLDFAQEAPDALPVLFHATLRAIRERLQHVRIVYPVPNRISLEQAQNIIGTFLSVRTGGMRMQAVSLALFRTIGDVLRLFDKVESKDINAADARTGKAADLECLSSDGEIVMAAEVKDRQLTLTDAQDKLKTVREKGVRELLYLVRHGVKKEDASSVAELSRREFATGQNVYVCDFEQFLESILVLVMENGRRIILVQVGNELDEKADLAHREAWRDLLSSI